MASGRVTGLKIGRENNEINAARSWRWVLCSFPLGFCDVNCGGDSCKIVRNGNACACACTSGDDDAGTSGSCSITCPGGCKAIANNGQYYCLCNDDDGNDVCDADDIDCPPQCEVTRDSNGKCQCVCF
ncbi:uncharacterized protein TNCV_2226761 [Trichonephila clavipes]|uniref:Uncharacterized protein n=1 Tax=Trichonephila clavipes TaxID=2585209 RepID=A0A8X7BIV4_TRICX|nr:uncharacterized protein TNCV_2226761 [Trichonephila clavipes]